ncbi:TonB-dependent receptor [bacterium]|nr:TonB-dependent receptor [bacterium]
MKKRLIAVGMIILFITAAFAQQNIRGFVIDATSGEPLPVANVSVKGQPRGASTNLDGFFAIPHLEVGEITLQVSYIGYQSTEVVVQVTDGAMDPIKIELLPESVSLNEVVFEFDSDDTDNEKRQSARVSTIPVDANTLRAMPSLGAEVDVLRALQAMPGVKASSELSSALYVRGGSSDMTLIQMDQSTVYNPSHLFGIFSTFNADAVKHLELMKGGFPAEYGGRSGSVLEVVTNDGNRRETEGVVSVGIVAARGAVEGPLPGGIKGSYAVSGRRTYMDPILSALRKNENFSDLPDYFFYDGNGKVNIDISPKTTLTLGGYMGLDKLDAEVGPSDSKVTIGTYWGNQTLTSRLRHVIGSNSFLTFGVAYSRYRSGFELYNEDVLLNNFKNRFRDTAIRTDYEYYGAANHQIKTGIEARRYSVEVRQYNEDIDYVNIDTTTWNVAHYIQDRWKIGSNFEMIPGLRWYWHQDGDMVRFDPRLAMMYHYDERTRFKLAGGRYHQFIDVMTAGDAASFFDIWVPNDGSLDPVYADQIVFGVEHDPAPGLELTFETYYNKYNDLNTFNMLIERGTDMASAFVKGEGYAYGFEWLLRKKTGRLQGWLGYSLSWTERQFPDTYINNGNPYYPKWDRRHDFVAVSNYQINKKWDFSTSWRYNTGQGYTEAVGYYVNRFPHVDNDFFPNGNSALVYGDKNNYRLPADHRLDLTASYKHKFLKKDAKLILSVYNVYSRRAIWFRNFDNSNLTTDPVVEVSDVKLLPIVPLVSYEVRF